MAGTAPKAPSPVIEQTLHSATSTSSSTFGNIIVSANTAVLFLDITAASGTSPTFNLYVQRLLPDSTTWTDICAFTQATGTTQEWFSLVSGSNQIGSVSDAALTAATSENINFGYKWRLKWVITGTSPSFTWTLYGEFA